MCKQYSTLLRRRGIKTKHQEVLTKISKISREELVSLVLDGAKLIDICSKYQINPTTCYYLLKQNSVDWSVNGYSTNNLELENMNIDELKDNLVNLLINNDSIASNNELSDLIDFVFNAPIDSNCTKEDLINYLTLSIGGNEEKVAIINPEQITTFTKKGYYKVTDCMEKNHCRETNIQMPTLMMATKQLHRFYSD